MTTVILSGAGDALGRRVSERLHALAHVDRVVTLGDELLQSHDLKAAAEGADVAVHLNGGLDETKALLDAAGDVGVRHVVVLSSATAYGAWASNPVPLTEDATLRPHPELEFAVRAAERERLAAEFRADHPDTRVAILRPATPVAEDADGWLAHGLRAAAVIRSAGDDDPPAQFVHLDDLASAVITAVDRKLDGPYNVAPDGWIAGDELRALAGRPRVQLPEKLARRLAPAAPGLRPYTIHPWVVANDRLKAAGWTPAYSNAEAFVAGTRPAPWANISPQRRQELALAGMVAGLAGVAAGAGFVGRALYRRRR